MDRPRRTRGWKVSWQMLLLAASVLSSCFLLTQAQETTGISIRVFPQLLKEGDSVTLTPEGLDLKKLSSCRWYRGTFGGSNLIFTLFLTPISGKENGRAYTGRETGNPDCSLRIADLKPSDSGNYSFKPEGLGVTNTGATSITVSEIFSMPVLQTTESLVETTTNSHDFSGGSSSSAAAGALTGTVIGSLAVILVLVGTLTYVFLRVCRRNGKTSTQVVSTPQIYENVPPPGQVHPENSSSTANTYETLQPRIQSVYEEIQR